MTRRKAKAGDQRKAKRPHTGGDPGENAAPGRALTIEAREQRPASLKKAMGMLKSGKGEAARREFIRWNTENGIPEGVEPMLLLFGAGMVTPRYLHQQEKGAKAPTLLKELRKRLAHALKTAESLARELAWPLPFPMPKVIVNADRIPEIPGMKTTAYGERMAALEAAEVPGGKTTAHLPDTAEIVDFLGRAIQSADGAIKKLSRSGGKHSVFSVFRNGLADAGVCPSTAVDFQVGVGLVKKGDRLNAIEAQRDRGKRKRRQRRKRKR